MTASALIYAAAGRPSFAVYGAEHVRDEAGICRLCGAEGEDPGRTVTVTAWG